MRLLGVDFGSKRIGIAVGDREHRVASPRPNLNTAGALDRDAESIAALARREEADAIVVGIPYEADGVAGRMARVCESLATRIEQRGWTVYRVDESLTSVTAERSMAELKGSVRRKKKDAEAACLILERFFNEKAP